MESARLAPKHVFSAIRGRDHATTSARRPSVHHLMRTSRTRTGFILVSSRGEAPVQALHDPRCKMACPRDLEKLLMRRSATGRSLVSACSAITVAKLTLELLNA